ncbi:hypothetical protein [Corynebacterium sp. TAE3-ERU2]|uniref:hypothetical protein n=1 Tax=Corynebacterium sp. TAE3-ERU2 TaxID=2849497 RepID=UPI001C48CC68|nr:hypothetical protein [Corynebacterium sp. TAE3-ERU2]MBV7302919.1 hypothetical protein [Corynebacterium sp. TAE3-ERU2]
MSIHIRKGRKDFLAEHGFSPSESGSPAQFWEWALEEFDVIREAFAVEFVGHIRTAEEINDWLDDVQKAVDRNTHVYLVLVDALREAAAILTVLENNDSLVRSELRKVAESAWNLSEQEER